MKGSERDLKMCFTVHLAIYQNISGSYIKYATISQRRYSSQNASYAFSISSGMLYIVTRSFHSMRICFIRFSEWSESKWMNWNGVDGPQFFLSSSLIFRPYFAHSPLFTPYLSLVHHYSISHSLFLFRFAENSRKAYEISAMHTFSHSIFAFAFLHFHFNGNTMHMCFCC